MTRWGSQSHPKSGLVVAAAGISIAFWSVWPWVQRPNDPWQSVDAGEIGAQRLPVLVLGLAILAIGIAVDTAGSRRLLLALSTIAGFAVLAVTNHAIDEVSEITAMNAEIVSEVGWALYGIEWAGLVVVIASIVGLRNVQLGATIAGFRYTDTADDAGHRWPTRARVVARWCALAVTLLVGPWCWSCRWARSEKLISTVNAPGRD